MDAPFFVDKETPHREWITPLKKLFQEGFSALRLCVLTNVSDSTYSFDTWSYLLSGFFHWDLLLSLRLTSFTRFFLCSMMRNYFRSFCRSLFLNQSVLMSWSFRKGTCFSTVTILCYSLGWFFLECVIRVAFKVTIEIFFINIMNW